MDQTALHDFAIFPPDAQSIFVMDQDAERRDRSGQGSVEETEGTAMKREKLELVRGGGNVFRDLGRDNADIEQLKALLAAEIIKALDRAGFDRPRRPCPNRLRRGRFSHAFGTPISPGSLPTGLYRFSTVSDRVSR